MLASLVAAGAARADGLPVLGIDAGPNGIVAPSGEERYVTIPAGINTVVARVGTSDGRIAASRLLPGELTIPAVAYDGSASGLSGDGTRLVLIQPRAELPAQAHRPRGARRAQPRPSQLDRPARRLQLRRGLTATASSST